MTGVQTATCFKPWFISKGASARAVTVLEPKPKSRSNPNLRYAKTEVKSNMFFSIHLFTDPNVLINPRNVPPVFFILPD